MCFEFFFTFEWFLSFLSVILVLFCFLVLFFAFFWNKLCFKLFCFFVASSCRSLFCLSVSFDLFWIFQGFLFFCGVCSVLFFCIRNCITMTWIDPPKKTHNSPVPTTSFRGEYGKTRAVRPCERGSMSRASWVSVSSLRSHPEDPCVRRSSFRFCPSAKIGTKNTLW